MSPQLPMRHEIRVTISHPSSLSESPTTRPGTKGPPKRGACPGCLALPCRSEAQSHSAQSGAVQPPGHRLLKMSMIERQQRNVMARDLLFTHEGP